MIKGAAKLLILLGALAWMPICLGDGVAVIDTNYLKKSSAAYKAIWEEWLLEFKAAEDTAKSEVTRQYAIKENVLFESMEKKIVDYLSRVKSYTRILDLAKDQKAKEAFSVDPTLTFELLGKIDNEWFAVKVSNEIINTK